MRRNGDRGLVGGDREILDRSYGFHRTGDRWLPDRWLGMPSQGPVIPPVPPFDPNSIAGLKGWWKADAITTPGLMKPGPKEVEPRAIADGDPVNAWPDSSGSNNTAVQQGTAPLYYGNVINGKPVVRIVPGRHMALLSPISTSLGWTIFAVMQSGSVGTETCSIGDANSGNNFGPLVLGGGARYTGVDGVGYTVPGTDDHGWHIVTGSTAPTIRVDGLVPLISTTGGTTAPGGVLQYIGLRNSFVMSYGDYAEILAYQGALSVTDCINVENYLGSKYGIPVAGIVGSIPGLKAWWAADRITAGALLRDVIESRDKLEIMPADFDPKAVPADGTPVTNLKDLSGGGNHLTVYGGAAGPPVFHATAGPNGKPWVSCDATQQLAIMALVSGNIPMPYTIIGVSDFEIYADPFGGVGLGAIYTQTCEAYAGAFDFTGGTPIPLEHGKINAVVSAIFAAGYTQLFKNGVLVMGGNAGSNAIAGMMIGGHSFGAGIPNNFCEVMVYAGRLSNANHAAVVNYLADKYKLPRLPFAPDQVAGIKGWWKADSLSQADGTAVVPWYDSSGNGNDTTLVAGNPLFYNNVINGKPVVRFATQAFGLTHPIDVTNGWTIFAVMKPASAASEICCLGDNNAQGNAGPLGNGIFWYIGHGGAWSNDGAQDANWHVFNATSAPSLYVDGNARSLTTGGSAAITNLGYIGLRNSGLYSSGDIAEIIAYEGILSMADRQAIQAYLMDKYAITIPPLPPQEQISGLQLWLQGSSIPQGDGSVIDLWPDSSLNGRSFFWSGVSPSQPVIKKNVINGHPAVFYDGSAGQVNNTTMPSMAGWPGYTIMVVARAAAVTGNVAMYSAGTYNNLSMSLRNEDNTGVVIQNSGTWVSATEPAGIVAGEWNILTCDWNGTNMHYWRNGALKATTGATILNSVGQFSSVGFQYPSASFDPGYFHGDIAEVYVYSHALADADRQILHNYLSTKYGIAVTPSRRLEAKIKTAIAKEVMERIKETLERDSPERQ